MASQSHPFDSYAAFTDIEALKAASSKPLRKSIRVNTLKTSVEKLQAHAVEKQWKLEPVPWCKEAFFVDRENRENALGKDLLHLLGHIYLQEAASMLPVELLGPLPGETILDMAAAPGSKTTQVAAKIGDRGVVVANDVQEKRLWTLKSALHRSGVTSCMVTRKVGQWFGGHATGRFDRVLCDAPCTAQGTSRKDSDALQYCSADNIGKMAKLQRELLTAAVHAAKVGGVIVYSTCTLTTEENEGVVSAILRSFPGQLEIVDPRTLDARFTSLDRAIEDSLLLQEKIGAEKPIPCVRLWPHVYDTEGFFCAVIRKIAPTRPAESHPMVRFQEERIPPGRAKELVRSLEEQFGTSFLHKGDHLFERGKQLLLTNEEISDFQLPVTDYSVGLPFALRLDEGRIRLDHETAALRGMEATGNICMLDDQQLNELLDGKDTTCDPSLFGDCLLQYQGLCVGVGLAREGKLKNRLPRWVVQKS